MGSLPNMEIVRQMLEEFAFWRRFIAYRVPHLLRSDNPEDHQEALAWAAMREHVERSFRDLEQALAILEGTLGYRFEERGDIEEVD